MMYGPGLGVRSSHLIFLYDLLSVVIKQRRHLAQ